MGHLSNPIGLRLFLNRYSSFLWSSYKSFFLITQQDFLIFNFLSFFFKLSIFKKLNCIFFNFKILRFFNYFYLNIFVYNFHLFSFFSKFYSIILKYKLFLNYFNFKLISINNFIFYYYIFLFRFNLFSKSFYFMKINKEFYNLKIIKFVNYYNYFNYMNSVFFILRKLNKLKHYFNKKFLIKKFNNNNKIFNIFKIFIKHKHVFLLRFKKLKKKFLKMIKFLIFNKLKFIFEKQFFLFLKTFLLFNFFKIVNNKINIFCNFFFLNPKYLDAKFLIQFLKFRLYQGISFQSLFFKINKILSLFLSKNRLLGFKISLKGRFSRKQRASFSWKRIGRVSLNSKLSYIDFASDYIILKYGLCSLKLWLNFSKIFFKKKFFLIV